MADNFSKKPLYIETDYDNIISIDPNKIVDNNVIKDRLVDHEELVIYANLETKVVPRTKLAVGETLDIFNTSVASLKSSSNDPSLVINFLQPQGKKFFDTSYTDQLTGKGAKTAEGSNQAVRNVKGTKDTSNYEDTQMLGIETINVTVNSIGVPKVSMRLIDVQGRTLFEQGEKSLYSVFFNMPYPLFYLTLKGYYGKAIRYALNLSSFNATFDSGTGNYQISLEFIGKLTGLLADTLLDYGIVAPKMFPTNIQTTDQTNNSATPNATVNTQITQTSVGAQKLDEVYGIYESKGLIPKGFPRLTIEEFFLRAENYDLSVQESIEKGDFTVLNDVQTFNNILDELVDTVYNKVLTNYLDTDSYIIKNNQIYYPYKRNIDFDFRNQLVKDIEAEINAAVKDLNNNTSFGTGENKGSYKIGNTTFEGQSIPVSLSVDDIVKKFWYTDLTEDDYRSSLSQKLGRNDFTDQELNTYKTQIAKEFELFGKVRDLNTGLIVDDPAHSPTFFTYGEKKIGDINYIQNSFFAKIDKLKSTLESKKTSIEQNFSDLLANKLINENDGLGFAPTIRNVFAIIMAGIDTFYRLMDQTHFDAWQKRNDPKRIQTVLPPSNNFGIDSKNQVNYAGSQNTDNVVYPWPTYFVKEKTTDGVDKYVIQYLGSPPYAPTTNAFDRTVWPEVFFTEKYLEAGTLKAPVGKKYTYVNQKLLGDYASSNSLEFPFSTIPYEDPSEISFFYEWWERTYLTSHYTQLFRGNYKRPQIDKFIADLEYSNISKNINNKPFLLEKLKNNPFDLTVLEDYLKTISNNGASTKYWNYERDNFTTEYINTLISKDYGLFSMDTIDGASLTLDTSVPLVENFKNYLSDTTTNELNFFDVYGLYNTDEPNVIYNTDDIFIFFDDKKTVARLKENSSGNKLTLNFAYEYDINKNFNSQVFVIPDTATPIKTSADLINYFTLKYPDYVNGNYTELSLLYSNYSGLVRSEQVTSMVNTPYFINALLKGIDNEKNGVSNPYVALGYLFLSSLNEELGIKSLNNTNINKDILTTLSKFSAIHQMPYHYILKYGAVWHRYKTWIESNKTFDILDDVWQNFDYENYYDSTLGNMSTQYTIKNYTGGTQTFKAFETILTPPANTQFIEKYNLGFYPKLINDFYWYFTKENLFNTYSATEFEEAYDRNKLRIGTNSNSSFFMPYSGDSNNLNRSIVVNGYFQYFIFDKNALVDKNNKVYIPVPSMGGSPFNQTVLECFTDTKKLKTEISNNPGMYNGSVRGMWGLSNFGYFDPIVKPQPDERITYGLGDGLYTNISRLIGTFNPQILDEFEKAFLGFCDPNAEASEILVLSGERTTPDYIDTNKIKNIKQRRLRDQILNLFVVKETDLTNPITNQENIDASNIAQVQQINMSKKLEEFINFDCILKIGNPSNFNRKVFNSFSTDDTLKPLQPLTYSEYVLGTLPGDGTGVSLLDSQSLNSESWIELQKYVGFSVNNNVLYSDSGSTITDFFIDNNIEFSSSNVQTLYPLIKIYAFQKYKTLYDGGSWDIDNFFNDYNNFLDDLNSIQSDMVREISSRLNKNLPNTKTEIEGVGSNVSGNVTKLSTYNTFQAFNDKWIAGGDFKSKTLFEDFLFVNAGNGDIGGTLQVNIIQIAKLLKERKTMTILDTVDTIMTVIDNMLFYAMPAYINFYGNQSPTPNAIPKPIDLPNSLFGTYTEVNYIDSKPKFVLMYVGKTSEHPKSNNNTVLYNDDSYDFRNPSTCPVRIPVTPPYNFSLSNKVVAFTVDFGIQNQNMFSNLEVGMDEKKPTGATFLVRDQIANGVNGDSIAQQTSSIYSLYLSSSYSCTVSSLGNVMIQPLMYFNLRHVPLFAGSYQIYSVEHRISAQGFETEFKGTRMPIYELPPPDSMATYIKQNYLEKYKSIALQRPNPISAPQGATTTLDQPEAVGTTLKPEDECQLLVNSKYSTLPFVAISRSNLTFNEFANLIKSISSIDKNIAITLFVIAITRSSNGFEDNLLQPINNNLFELTGKNTYSDDPRLNSLVCTSVDNVTNPLFSFVQAIESIEITYKLYQNLGPIVEEMKLLNTGNQQETTKQAIAQFIIATWDTGYGFTGKSASQMKDFVLTNVQNETILPSVYSAYQQLVELAVTYFP